MKNSKKFLIVFSIASIFTVRWVSHSPVSDLLALSVAAQSHSAFAAPARATISTPAAPSILPRHELRFDTHVVSDMMKTTRMQDYYREPWTGQWLEVVGSMSMIHEGRNGIAVSDKLAHWSRQFGKPLSRSRAIRLATAIARPGSYARGNSSKSLHAQLKVLPNLLRTDAHLVYWMDFSDRLVVLDAETGQLIHSISKHRTIAALPKIKVYSAKGLGLHTADYSADAPDSDIPESLSNTCQLISTQEGSAGQTILINPELCTQVVEASQPLAGADADAMRALENSSLVASYYLRKHGRNSYDGKGSELVNVVHAGDALDNAFWDEGKSFMAYGDGDGEGSKSYTLSLDIAGHEMTHGVTAETAKLIGSGEPGALNEAYSDFFGIMISTLRDPNPDWSIGKEISPPSDGQGAGIRSLARPEGFNTEGHPFPSKVSQMLAVGEECTEKNDQCEVHGNSTIPGHASYLVAKALEDRSGNPQNRHDRAAKLYYTVLTQWLTANDGFATAAGDTVQACKLMYDDATCDLVAQAFYETEMLTRP